MRTYKGKWTARVDQDFEIEAESREEAEQLLEQEIAPHRVAELLDIETEFEDEDEE